MKNVLPLTVLGVSTDYIRLSMCEQDTGNSNPTHHFVEVDWYVTKEKAFQQGASQGYQRGDFSNKIAVTTFAGTLVNIKYPNGNQLQINISSGAASLTDGSYAGYAWNNFHSFLCYKSSGEFYLIDYGVGGEGCNTVYYCEQA
ncbi:hypothetical protein HK100_006753 [Physocladia obscura]|uniref:Uncharacterized protein n=1 Tax=Physocladia obscura TaxID=109957 RepID=A0AAD5SRU5_9FUNG|nr:hypothetical protein HK100_006753 [Physocladia obscura]